MKQIFTSLLGVSLLATTLLSCSKDVQKETRQQAAVAPEVIKANVPAGQTYVLNLVTGNSASIQTQARHYQVSEMATASDGSTVYKYTGGKGYAGADEVTLQQTITSTVQNGGGCHNNHSSSYTTTTTLKTTVIKFTVAN